jgi:hypothetical protein
MPRLTSRDYKRGRRSALEVGRYRQFLYGTGVGIVLTSAAFLYAGTRSHAAPPAGPAAGPVLAAAPGAAAAGNGAEALTFPDMLARTQVPLPPADKHAKRAAPVAHRAPDAAR